MANKTNGNFCSAKNCPHSQHEGMAFFHLPWQDEERCLKWIQNMGREDLIGKSMLEIQRHCYRLCSTHFESNQFNVPPERKNLVWDAVPTIFDIPYLAAPVNVKKRRIGRMLPEASFPRKMSIDQNITPELPLEQLTEPTTSKADLSQKRKMSKSASCRMEKMQTFKTSSCLTVEQMEVIRRLRNTGATLQQITETYQMLDKVDKELGSFGLVDSRNSQSCYLHINKKSSVESQSSSGELSDDEMYQTCDGMNNIQEVRNASPLSSQQGCEINASSYDTMSRDGDSNNIPVIDAHTQQLDNCQAGGLPDGVLKETSRCFLLSLQKDSFVEFIKKCASFEPTSRYFDPCLLTKNHGLSESETEMFINGEMSSLESDKQTIVIDWLLDILCKGDWFVQSMRYYSEHFMSKDSSGAGDLHSNFTPRRERFTFRDAHIAVLESKFNKNQYPSAFDKTLIANECNVKLAISYGHELQQKERVNPFHVDNWFRNKRKDLIRKSKIERLDPKSVSQARLFSEDHQMDKKPTMNVGINQQISNYPTNQITVDNALQPCQSNMFFPMPSRPSISTLPMSLNAAYPHATSSSPSSPPSSSFVPSSSGNNTSTEITIKKEIDSEEESAGVETIEEESKPLKINLHNILTT